MCLVLLLFSGCCSASRRAVPMRNQRIDSVTVRRLGRFWYATADRSFLQAAFPLIADVADFYVSRSVLDHTTGRAHLVRTVLRPEAALSEGRSWQ